MMFLSVVAEVLDGDHGLLNTVGVELGVGDLEVDDGVDLHGYVILGDNGLGREVRDLLLERDDLGDFLDKGDLEVQADVPRCLIRTEELDDVGLCLLHDTDAADKDKR